LLYYHNANKSIPARGDGVWYHKFSQLQVNKRRRGKSPIRAQLSNAQICAHLRQPMEISHHFPHVQRSLYQHTHRHEAYFKFLPKTPFFRRCFALYWGKNGRCSRPFRKAPPAAACRKTTPSLWLPAPGYHGFWGVSRSLWGFAPKIKQFCDLSQNCSLQTPKGASKCVKLRIFYANFAKSHRLLALNLLTVGSLPLCPHYGGSTPVTPPLGELDSPGPPKSLEYPLPAIIFPLGLFAIRHIFRTLAACGT
jgi:hypothetical protein